MLARANGFEVRTATSPAAALAVCEAESFDVVLIDLNYARDTTSGREGLDLPRAGCASSIRRCRWS